MEASFAIKVIGVLCEGKHANTATKAFSFVSAVSATEGRSVANMNKAGCLVSEYLTVLLMVELCILIIPRLEL